MTEIVIEIESVIIMGTIWFFYWRNTPVGHEATVCYKYLASLLSAK